MQLTTKAAVDLLNALTSLNGQPKAVTVNGNQAIILEPFTFSAQTRTRIAKNIARLTPISATYNKARDSVIESLSGGQNFITEGAVEMMANFRKSETELLQELCSVKLEEITEAELRLDVNAIQPSNLAAMTIIVTEWAKEFLAPVSPVDLAA